VGRRVHANTPHPARKKLKLEYDDVARNPRLIAPIHRFGEKGPDAALAGSTTASGRSGLLYYAR
jgi:formyl-CoA transferase